MKIQIPTADLKSAFTSAVTSAIGGEKQLAASAQAQVQALVDELYPLVVSQTQGMITSKDPAIEEGYLAILQGTVEAKIAELGLAALATQRNVISGAIATGVKILGLLLKAAVIA